MAIRRRTLSAALAFCALIAVGCASKPAAQDSHPTVSILGGTSIALHGGESRTDVRALIDVSIGGGTQSLLFDTGSVGLSVLSSSVPSSVQQMTGPAFQEMFDGGVVLSGVIIEVPVSISSVSTAGRIAIRLVQTVACESQDPDCAAKDGMSSFSRSIGADGIFGAGLWANGSIFNPLLQLSGSTTEFITIQWDGSSGSVTVNGTVQSDSMTTLPIPSAAPATLPNGLPAWSNSSVAMCWQIGAAQSTCTSTSFDTGSSAMSFPIDFPGGPTSNVKEFPSGQTIKGYASEGAEPFLTFTTGRKLGSDLVTVIPGQTIVDTGIQIFRSFTVVLSITDGSIALAEN